jgi:hypothetical protein
MRTEIEDRAAEGARGITWVGIAPLLCALVAPSCATFPGASALPPFLSSGQSLVQEGELTVADGAEAAVTYRKPFQSPPRVTIVEFRQSWSKEKSYSKSDFVFVRTDATGFRVLNNHPEQGQGSMATIKWRAEGVAGAVPPPLPPRDATPPSGQNNLLPQDQLVAALRGMGGTVGFDPPPVPKAAPPVVSIDLHHTKVTDADLEQLQLLTRLRSLNLSGTGITDAGMRPVGGLVTLQTLLLNETRIGDAGLQQLQHLTELRELSLFHTRVTDDGLTALRGLVNLRDLTLGGRQITDRGVAQLADLRNLRHLYLSDAGVSKAGVRELKKALPKVEIIQ